MTSKAKTRLYVEAPLNAGGLVELPKDKAHFLKNVLRLNTGQHISFFNGRDGEWLGRIETLSKSSATVALENQTRPQSPMPDVWLVFAPIKRARIDFVAEKATELGVAQIRPVITRRTVMARVNTGRLEANALEAAEQCERLDVPQVFEPQQLDKLLDSWPAGRRILWCDEGASGGPIAHALAKLDDAARRDPWAILIGPEGGFDEVERARLIDFPDALAVTLGPRLLRADTAAAAALSIWQAWVGDWDLTPS
jgi:16S rRNA (uracil1498-N3)-methyltransferase